MVTRIIDITAMTFSKRMKFREYLFSHVAPSLQKVNIVKNHASFPIVEMEFETDDEADHFINTLLAAASVLKSYMAIRDGKGVRIVHSTKYDRHVKRWQTILQNSIQSQIEKQHEQDGQ
jgi:hypothetical protein